MDIDKIIESAEIKIAEKRDELAKLEREKLDIIERFEKASDSEKALIQKEMLLNEKSFEKLLTESIQLAEKIKIFRTKIEGGV
jgi:hypothetical protein